MVDLKNAEQIQSQVTRTVDLSDRAGEPVTQQPQRSEGIKSSHLLGVFDSFDVTYLTSFEDEDYRKDHAMATPVCAAVLQNEASDKDGGVDRVDVPASYKQAMASPLSAE
jgi:hypothetical protein